MNKRVLTASMVVALAASACGGGGDGTTETGGGGGSGTDLASLSVETSDLPQGYAVVADETGSIDAAKCISDTEAGGEYGADLAAKLRDNNLTGCYGSKLRKEAQGNTSEIGTLALRFADPAKAASFFPAMPPYLRQSFTANLTVSDLPAPGVGEESSALKGTQSGNPIEGVLVAWRRGDVVSMLFSFHVTTELSADNIVELAKRIDGRATAQ